MFPPLAILFGLSCGRIEARERGAASGRRQTNLQQGEAPGLCLRLPGVYSPRGQRLPYFTAPDDARFVLFFVLQVVLCDSNKPTVPGPGISLSGAPGHAC